MTDATPLPAPRLDLGPHERRALGVLIEKALATPEYYPLTLKALVAGCNQRNNRDPVMDLAESDVEAALAGLRSRGFVMSVRTDTGWATRWRHEVDRRLAVGTRELAILAELLLRGPQTEGELRTRAGRMTSLQDLEAVHEVLARLQEAAPPLVTRLSPPGAIRGVRYADLLQPASEVERVREAGSHPPAREIPVAPPVAGLEPRLAALEERVRRLEEALGVSPADPD